MASYVTDEFMSTSPLIKDVDGSVRIMLVSIDDDMLRVFQRNSLSKWLYRL